MIEEYPRESLYALANLHSLLISVFSALVLVQYVALFYTFPFANVENRPSVSMILCLYSFFVVSTQNCNLFLD